MAKKKAAPVRDAGPVLERIMGGPLTFGDMLRSIRGGDEVTLEAFARRLDISRANLCDIEQGRKGVSPERALKWAKLLGYPEAAFVQLALQSELDTAGIKYTVELRAGRRRRAA
jgi:transcriptional regulator with XRE-family HTH domain